MAKKKGRKPFKFRSEAQKKAIAASYAGKSKRGNSVRVEAPYPHFRYYKKSHHPALIIGEQKGEKKDDKGKIHITDEYRYRKVMHGEKDGARNNEKVYPNPNPKDPKPMYIGKRVRHDEKKNFENLPLPWKYPKQCA